MSEEAPTGFDSVDGHSDDELQQIAGKLFEADTLIWDKFGWHVSSEFVGFKVHPEMLASPTCAAALSKVEEHLRPLLSSSRGPLLSRDRKESKSPFANIQECVDAVLTITRRHPTSGFLVADEESATYYSCIRLGRLIYRMVDW